MLLFNSRKIGKRRELGEVPARKINSQFLKINNIYIAVLINLLIIRGYFDDSISAELN